MGLSRSQFLCAGLKNQRAPIRPPWSCVEGDFLELCSSCGDCIVSCPQKILVSGRGHYPQVDFSVAECTFCAACADACETGAIHRGSNGKDLPWQMRAVINEHCLAVQKVVCRSCSEACDYNAIHFHLSPGCVSQPSVDEQVCTGCGACVSSCPTDAIAMRKL